MATTSGEAELTVTLPPELAKLVRASVASGEYTSPVDVVRAALCYLEDHELDQLRKREELQKLIDEGLRDLAAGHVSTKSAQEILEEIRAERTTSQAG